MRRILAVLAAVCVLTGAGMMIKSALTQPFTDEAAFNRQVAALSVEYSTEWQRLAKAAVSTPATPATEGARIHYAMRAADRALSPRYWAVYDTYRTNRDTLHDYGAILLVAGVALLLVGPLGGWTLRTPPRRWMLRVAMFVPPLLTFGADVLESMAMMAGSNMPPWGEPPGAAVIFGFLVFGPLPVIWMVLHLPLVPEVYYRAQPLSLALSRRINPWLGLLALLAAIFTLIAAWHGAWTWTVANLAWLYIYLCMAATRRAPHLYADLEPEWPPAWNTAR
jgi:hypothetical protein